MRGTPRLPNMQNPEIKAALENIAQVNDQRRRPFLQEIQKGVAPRERENFQ